MPFTQDPRVRVSVPENFLSNSIIIVDGTLFEFAIQPEVRSIRGQKEKVHNAKFFVFVENVEMRDLFFT